MARINRSPFLSALAGGVVASLIMVVVFGVFGVALAKKPDKPNPSDVVKVAHAATFDAANQNGTVLTTTITTDRPGTLVVNGGIDSAGTANDAYVCRLEVNDTFVKGSDRIVRVDWAGAGYTHASDEDCATTGAVDVPAGTHKVDLEVIDLASASLDDAALWALFIPTE